MKPITPGLELEIRKGLVSYLLDHTWEGSVIRGRTLISMFGTGYGITTKGNPVWMAIITDEALSLGWKIVPDPQNDNWWAVAYEPIQMNISSPVTKTKTKTSESESETEAEVRSTDRNTLRTKTKTKTPELSLSLRAKTVPTSDFVDEEPHDEPENEYTNGLTMPEFND